MKFFKRYYSGVGVYPSVFLSFIMVYLSIFSLAAQQNKCRCLPNEDCWPSKEEWDNLNKTVHGRLRIPISPIHSCLDDGILDHDPDSCITALSDFGKDPFLVQTFSGGTQSTGKGTTLTSLTSFCHNMNKLLAL